MDGEDDLPKSTNAQWSMLLTCLIFDPNFPSTPAALSRAYWLRKISKQHWLNRDERRHSTLTHIPTIERRDEKVRNRTEGKGGDERNLESSFFFRSNTAHLIRHSTYLRRRNIDFPVDNNYSRISRRLRQSLQMHFAPMIRRARLWINRPDSYARRDARPVNASSMFHLIWSWSAGSAIFILLTHRCISPRSQLAKETLPSPKILRSLCPFFGSLLHFFKCFFFPVVSISPR